MLDQDQREQLREQKPLLSHEKVESLAALLARLPDSSRYFMTSGLQVAQFLTSSPFPPEDISGLTLRELVEEGPLRLVLVDGIDNEHVDDLIGVLQSLTESSEELIDYPSSKREIPVPEDVPRYSSIEAERLIREGIAALKESDCFDRIKEKPVGDFWKKEAVSAPFLETLTFADLTKIEVESLLKKRTMTDTKIHYLILLLNTVVEDVELTETEKEASQPKSEENSPRKRGILPKGLAELLIRFIRFLSAEDKK